MKSQETFKKIDLCVIGAGIIGLSTAYHLKNIKPELNVLLLEKEGQPSKHQTGRNSGVIHSGIYYKPGSLKAMFCRDGLKETYEFCVKNNIPHKKTGKLIVAKNRTELENLNLLMIRGIENGLKNIELLGKDEIIKIEPYCVGEQALSVPETGVVDYIKMSQTLLTEFEKQQGVCNFGALVTNIDSTENIISYIKNGVINKVNCKVIINCAGIHADEFLENSSLKIIPFRGEYFSIKLNRSYLVKNLIYPVPDQRFPFLGIHFTRSIYDHIHVGPNAVLAFAKEAYGKFNFELTALKYLLSKQMLGLAMRYPKYGLKEQIRSLSKIIFLNSAKELIPDINLNDLEIDTPGIRAQAVENWGHLVDDFRIITKDKTLHVLNAPSPAATSSLPIGRHIANQAIKLLQL